MASKLEEARNIINEVDAQIAELFVQRMRAVETVFEYKKEFGLPILDKKREDTVVEKNSALIEDKVLREYYKKYIRNLMEISREYQHQMQEDLNTSKIHMNLGENSYDIFVERGILQSAGNHLNLDRRVLIVTDQGVPEVYAKIVAAQCKEAVVYSIKPGEDSKSLEKFEKIIQIMLEHGFSRKDCVVAVGGGVVGDLSGFAASAYMRGIDFYNIPTTLLSQIDSSIGGKTAINFGNVKNIVGAFYQPKKVLIDPELLETLSERQISNGLAEAIKMALTSDKELFEIFEHEDIDTHLDEIIIRSLKIKKSVVEQDEKESGIRKILNFGHTIGHGIETSGNLKELYHGECVALGMIPMCDEKIRQRVIDVLKKCNLYNKTEFDWEKIAQAAFHDKKADGDYVTVTIVPEVGSFEIKTLKSTEVIEMAKEVLC